VREKISFDARRARRQAQRMLTLYDYLESGNAYKVRLILKLRGIPFRRVELDILKRETRTPEFLAKNPNGRIPAVELEDGRVLFESNAILAYFAEGTELAGRDAWERAQILQWMFFEQYSHEPYVATLRFWHFAKLLATKTPAEIEAKQSAGNAALAIMDAQLAARDYFVGERFTIADIALFAYTHVAGEGGFDLSRYPHVRRWIARIEAQPKFVPIGEDFGVPASPVSS
jgi:glutathione S-transferase